MWVWLFLVIGIMCFLVFCWMWKKFFLIFFIWIMKCWGRMIFWKCFIWIILLLIFIMSNGNGLAGIWVFWYV